MRCPKCQEENPSDARFCTQCGAGIEIPCANCGAANAPRNKFCQHCGQPLASVPAWSGRFASPTDYTPAALARKIRAARPAVERERKQVTVLFTDVSGFTSLSEQLDPEEVQRLMQRCFDLMLEAVHRYEGTVSQFLGDGLLALFGAPIAHEDHAQRAMLAALDIEKALARYRDELRQNKATEFRVRSGLNSGLVVVGTISDSLYMEYTAVGDTVNLAARMVNVAGPGQIVISEQTHQAVGHYFVTRPLGPQTVKGKAIPVAAFEVLQAREFRTRIDVELERGFSPLVGRQKELALLRERFAEAKSGRGQIVFVIGEPGVGKSRLLFEFRRSLEGESFSWLTGRCISFGSQMPYLPVVDILKRFLQIEEADAESAVIQKCEQKVSGLGEELRPAIPYLKGLLSVNPGDDTVAKMDARVRRMKTFEALRALTLKLAGTRPLVLVLEDLHWMDKASEEVLLYLTDSIAASQVLMILTHRPGYQNPFGDRTYAARQALNRLSDAESIRLAEGMLGTTNFPAELREIITSKAEGNPFFVEEVIKSLLELGALQRHNGHYVATRPVSDIHVPDTIQDVIAARIDRLEESAKQALQLAAVIGREFTVSLLGRISDLKDQLGKLLQDLKVLELIYERSLFPELAYMFKHALTQDVAYNTLLIQRRKDLHRLVAMAIEELYAERLAEFYEMLAYHYEKGEVWDKALGFLVKAGQKALQGYANQDALAYFDRALAVSKQLKRPVEPAALEAIYRGKGLAHFLMSQHRTAAAAYQQLLIVAEKNRDRASQMEAVYQTGMSYFWSHDFEQALSWAERARSLALEANDQTMLASSKRLFAFVYCCIGRVTEAIALTDEALKLSRETGNTFLEADTLTWQALNHNFQGNFDLALRCLDQGATLGKSNHFLVLFLWMSWMKGLFQGGKGEFDRSLASLQDALQWSQRFQDQIWRCRILNTLGWIYSELYNFDHAVRYNQIGLDASRTIGDPEIIRNAGINLGDCALRQGDLD
ncbi:MAG: zinc-ribbon domain-containing protein [Verrucomicrobia bacterium]|nr:zinc-ribbon domain-containing protein [Verrucomicrobiota bacterium]